MQVEFISHTVDVMTHDCLSSVALALAGGFLKHRVNWTTGCYAIGELLWQRIFTADNPVGRLNVHLSLQVELFVPTKVICVCVTGISLGLLMTHRSSFVCH